MRVQPIIEIISEFMFKEASRNMCYHYQDCH
jgi:hypothetical protein